MHGIEKLFLTETRAKNMLVSSLPSLLHVAWKLEVH
jgi:hypothetical protein